MCSCSRSVMNPNGASADFMPVKHQIIGSGPDSSRILEQHVHVVGVGRGERVVHGGVPFLIDAPLQEWEIQ